MRAQLDTVRVDTRKCAAISLWVMMAFGVLVIVVVFSMSAVLFLAQAQMTALEADKKRITQKGGVL